MYLACRYLAQGPDGGEWWDNNSGQNYRIVFRRETVPIPAATRTNSLPPLSDVPPLQLKARPTMSLLNPAFPQKRPSMPYTSPTSPLRLQLRNYVPPSSTNSSAGSSPPTSRSSSLAPSPSLEPRLSLDLIGGQPATLAPSPSISLPNGRTSPPRRKSPPGSPINDFVEPSFGNAFGLFGANKRMDTSDSSYAALVKQWCFHQPPRATSPSPLGSPGSPPLVSSPGSPVTPQPTSGPTTPNANGGAGPNAAVAGAGAWLVDKVFPSARSTYPMPYHRVPGMASVGGELG